MMKKLLKKFEVIIADGSDVRTIYTVGKSAESVSNTLEGNGEIVRIKEVPDLLPSAAVVRRTLKNADFGEAECDIVYHVLQCLEGTSEDFTFEDFVKKYGSLLSDLHTSIKESCQK